MREPVATRLPGIGAPFEWAITADGVLYTAQIAIKADGSFDVPPRALIESLLPEVCTGNVLPRHPPRWARRGARWPSCYDFGRGGR